MKNIFSSSCKMVLKSHKTLSYKLLQYRQVLGGIYRIGINVRRSEMKKSFTVLVCCCFLAGGALADGGVIDKTGSALERGAEATVHGIKRGVEAMGNGIQRGAEAAGHGIEVGLSAAGRGIRTAAEATSRALHKVAEKVSPSSEG
jgi:hypothetical protein